MLVDYKGLKLLSLPNLWNIFLLFLQTYSKIFQKNVPRTVVYLMTMKGVVLIMYLCPWFQNGMSNKFVVKSAEFWSNSASSAFYIKH